MRRTSGSVVCPRCGRLVGVTEPRCANCGAWQPGMFGYGPGVQRWLGRLDLPNLITLACAALYVASLALDPAALLRVRDLFDILAPSPGALDALGMTGGYALAQGRWWTVFTAVFLHGSLLHILFNMVIMRRYLAIVADLYGAARAWVIFMVAGAAGFVLSDIASGAPTIGASGSIFGVFAALIVYGRRSGQAQATQQMWLTALVMFAFGFFYPSVNNWAHAGGFAGGFVAAEAMGFAHQRTGPAVLVPAGLLLLAVVGGFGLEIARVALALTGHGG
ncbi:MAG TPA: rhomboid family intramembrane serine protease [Candidatus Eisenbacteria bacterium]|nr:rhomboid family intramembrane serine protease [Candidatus Eisenbacteria bacterium]